MEKTGRNGIYYRRKVSKSTGKEEKIFYISYYDPNKKRHLECVGSSLKGMTAAKASNIRSMRIMGKQLSNRERTEIEKKAKQEAKGRWTVTKLWEDYKHHKQTQKGRVTDENRFLNYLKPAFGNKQPQEITMLEVTDLRTKLLRKLSPQTTRHVLELLQRLANYGVRVHQIAPLPFKIEMPSVDNQKTEDLTPAEFQRLWEAIEEETNIQAKHFIKMVLFTGMRRGELFKLKWDDIDFDRGFIFIRDPKGGKSQNIPLNPSAKELLLNHERPFADSPFVFPGREGKQRTDIKRPMNQIKKRAQLPEDFRPLHGLRHVYASMLASSGKVDMYTLQKLLTHKSPQMTQRYAHLRDEALKQASMVVVDVMQETIRSKG